MPPDKRRPQSGGIGRGPRKNIAAVNRDGSKLRPQAPENQAFPRRRNNYARDAVYEEFGYRNARALDYGAFVDRKPGPARRRWMVAP